MKKLQAGMAVGSGVVILMLALCVFLCSLPVRGSTYQVDTDYLTGWLTEDGGEVSLYEVFGDETEPRTFYRYVDGSDVNGRSLCLITHNLLFSVYLDDVMLYDYRPRLGGIYGVRYGESVHTIPLPTFTDLRKLRIEATSLRQDGSSGCNEAVLQDSRAFLHDMAEKEALKVGFCLLTFFFGILLFGLAIVEDQMRCDMLEAICLGAVTLIISAWIGSQTMLMRVLSPNPAMMRVVEYVTLDVLPIPVLIYIDCFAKTKGSKHLMTVACLSLLNTLVSVIGVLLGRWDYSDLLPVTHLMIVAGTALIIYYIGRAVRRREISRQKSVYIVSAMGVLVLSGMVDMVRYYLNKSANLAFLSVGGLFVFAAILAVYEYRRLIEMQVRSTKTELMQALAMEDTLTGLGSRAAFMEYEKKLMTRSKGKCLFVHFDVNHLKTVNDVYGHAEGDKHLIAAANVLQASFGAYGKCFRVGGDEFYAILDGITCEEDYALALQKFSKAQTEYNSEKQPPVPLAIAHGMAEYDYTVHNPETAERLADSRMYEEKRRMKALRVV